MRRRLRGAILHFVLSACAAGTAVAFDLSDPFATADSVSPTPAGRLALPGGAPCRATALATPLALVDAVRRALCNNPRTREAWANVEAEAAAVGLGRAAYLPNLTLNGSIAHVNESDRYSGMSEFDSSFSTLSNEETANLSWVLYDFGLRSANLRYARALLNAASASQDAAVQRVFIDAAQAYYEAQAAQAASDAAVDAEAAARRSFEVADGKNKAGVGTTADALQAKTAFAQATLRRIQTNDDFEVALGALAGAMGLSPNTALRLPKLVDDAAETSAATQAAGRLIAQAMKTHPKIVAARAQLEAARDNVEVNRDGGRPSLAFSAIEDRSDTPINRVSSEQTITTTSVGLQLSIPLFEGFSRTYKVRQAEAQASGKEAALHETEQEIAQEVWKNYLGVQKSSEDIKAIQTLLSSADESFELAQGRYRAGVGGILELLKAQTDLAEAEERHLYAIAHWHLSRLQLGASLGQINFAALQEHGAPARPVPAVPRRTGAAAPEQDSLQTTSQDSSGTSVGDSTTLMHIADTPAVKGKTASSSAAAR